jgi:hypothetical protein
MGYSLQLYAQALGIPESDLLQVDKPGTPTFLAQPAYVSRALYDRINNGAFLQVVDAATVHRGERTVRLRKGELTLV